MKQRNPGSRLRLAAPWAVLLALCATPARAQDASAAGRLDTLLTELRSVSKEAWDGRVAAMRNDVEARAKQAAALREQAKQLLAQAAKLDAEVTARKAEIGQLAKLRELLGAMQFGGAPAKPDEAPAAKPEAAPEKKPAEKKPAEKKPADKKPAETKPPAKEPAETKPAETAPAAMPAASSGVVEAAAAVPAESLYSYDEHVFDIFEQHCTVCHDTFDAEGGLDLSTFAGTIEGGGSGRTLRRGNPEASRLFLLVSHREKPKMPPRGPRIADDKIAIIRQWIAQGAPKDATEAEQFAAQRREEAAAAAARASARQAAGALPEILPDRVPALERTIPDRPPALRAIAHSPVAPVLAVPGIEQILLLQADSLAELAVLPFELGHVTSLAFTADGSRLLAAGGTAGQRGGAVLYDVRTGAELGRFAEGREQVFAAAPSPDGRMVAVGTTRRSVSVFSADDPEQVLYRVGHDDWVTALAFSASGDLLASADRKGTVHVTEARTGRDAHSMRGHEGAVLALAFPPGDTALVSAGADGRTMGWSLKDGERTWNQRHHGGPVHGLAVADAKRLVSAGADGALVTMQAADGKRVARQRIAGDWIYGVAASAERGRLFTADWTAEVAAVDAEKLQVLARVRPFVIDP